MTEIAARGLQGPTSVRHFRRFSSICAEVGMKRPFQV
jgi:hypothetical protein